MKKIFFILFSFAMLVAMSCSNPQKPVDTSPHKAQIVQTVDLQQTAVAIDQVQTPVYLVQDQADPPPSESNKSFKDILAENWLTILISFLGFVELIVRLTPTQKDNSILNFLLKILNAIIPNFSKSGGTFNQLE